jgi:hypothetical protein
MSSLFSSHVHSLSLLTFNLLNRRTVITFRVLCNLGALRKRLVHPRLHAHKGRSQYSTKKGEHTHWLFRLLDVLQNDTIIGRRVTV